MGKFRLDLDALAVESFDTAPPDENQGTVHGNQQQGTFLTLFQVSCGGSCVHCGGGGFASWQSCVVTCGQTCNPRLQTCGPTCFGTCGDTCGGTCRGTCGFSCPMTCGPTCHTCHAVSCVVHCGVNSDFCEFMP
jgi:hypothetical protein